MTHEREKSADNGRCFLDEFCRPIKIGRFHDTSPKLGGLFWLRLTKFVHGRFRWRSSCSFLRTGCMHERHLNFKIISRHALKRIRPKRHVVCVYEWSGKTDCEFVKARACWQNPNPNRKPDDFQHVRILSADIVEKLLASSWTVWYELFVHVYTFANTTYSSHLNGQLCQRFVLLTYFLYLTTLLNNA